MNILVTSEPPAPEPANTLVLSYSDANKWLPLLRSDHFGCITLTHIDELKVNTLTFLIQLLRLLKADVPKPLFREKYVWKEPITSLNRFYLSSTFIPELSLKMAKYFWSKNLSKMAKLKCKRKMEGSLLVLRLTKKRKKLMRGNLWKKKALICPKKRKIVRASLELVLTATVGGVSRNSIMFVDIERRYQRRNLFRKLTRVSLYPAVVSASWATLSVVEHAPTRDFLPSSQATNSNLKKKEGSLLKSLLPPWVPTERSNYSYDPNESITKSNQSKLIPIVFSLGVQMNSFLDGNYGKKWVMLVWVNLMDLRREE